MTLVSIIIPCYNSGTTLDETMRSALAQDHRELEIVLVDDGSSDPFTLERIGYWKTRSSSDKRLKVVRQENRGLPAARNVGIQNSRGQYFLPLDSDDLIEPSYVRLAAGVLDSEPDVGIVYCRADLFGDKNGEWLLPDFTMEQVLVENCIFATSLFRHEDWVANGGYDESMRAGREDHDYILKVLGLGRTVHRLDDLFFHYRQHPRSMNRAISAEAARDKLISAYAQLFRNNIRLYEANAEAFWRAHFGYIDQRNQLRMRYRHLEKLRTSKIGKFLLTLGGRLKSKIS